MQQVQVRVEHCNDIPGEVPAVWRVTPTPLGVSIDLKIQAGLPTVLADHYRAMALRDAMPEQHWDHFTITTEAVPVYAVA